MINGKKLASITIGILMIFFATAASASDAGDSLPSKESVEAAAETTGIFAMMFRTVGMSGAKILASFNIMGSGVAYGAGMTAAGNGAAGAAVVNHIAFQDGDHLSAKQQEVRADARTASYVGGIGTGVGVSALFLGLSGAGIAGTLAGIGGIVGGGMAGGAAVILAAPVVAAGIAGGAVYGISQLLR